VQPIFTRLAKPYDQAIITIIFIDHGVIVAIAAIHKATKSAETV
jgi:hypothetical protein